MLIFAIDPGTTESGFVIYDSSDRTLIASGKSPNDDVLQALREWPECYAGKGIVVIERIESYGMAVGVEVFETVFWSGRFAEAAIPARVARLSRRDVKLHLCHSARAKDANVRRALLDRWGGEGAKGTKANPGPLHGVSGDVWAALGVAVTWAELTEERQAA